MPSTHMIDEKIVKKVFCNLTKMYCHKSTKSFCGQTFNFVPINVVVVVGGGGGDTAVRSPVRLRLQFIAFDGLKRVSQLDKKGHKHCCCCGQRPKARRRR